MIKDPHYASPPSPNTALGLRRASFALSYALVLPFVWIGVLVGGIASADKLSGVARSFFSSAAGVILIALPLSSLGVSIWACITTNGRRRLLSVVGLCANLLEAAALIAVITFLGHMAAGLR